MKKLFLALPLLLAGCQSARVAFHFQPVAPALSSAPRVGFQPPATEAALHPRAEETPDTREPAGNGPTVIDAPNRRLAVAKPPAAAAMNSPMPTAELPTLATNSVTTAPATTPRSWQWLLAKRLVRQHATAGPAHTTESGLGGIGLFFIAIVLGLLAGLGALVSLIPGIGFFGGVGLAAAGLLVLFLLYSLVSGGKKKKPAK